MDDINKLIQKIKLDLAADLDAAESSSKLEEIKRKYLGKKGSITSLLKELGKLPQSDRPRFGNLINSEKKAASALIDEKLEKKFGFALLIFEFHRPGISNYISNADRSSMVEALRETADRLEKKQTCRQEQGAPNESHVPFLQASQGWADRHQTKQVAGG